MLLKLWRLFTGTVNKGGVKGSIDDVEEFIDKMGNEAKDKQVKEILGCKEKNCSKK